MNINLNNGHINLPVPVIKKKIIGVLRETADENPHHQKNSNGRLIAKTNYNNNGTTNNISCGQAVAAITSQQTTSAAAMNGHNNLVDICKRRMDWTRQWLLKNQFMSAENLLPELKSNEIYYFNDYFKMTEKQFRYLVGKLSPLITKKEPQRKKKSFSAEERLAIALKYLATGEFHSCKHYCFKASQHVIQTMITDICLAIYETLSNDFIRIPKNAEEWREISHAFIRDTKLPNCTGSLIARHILFKRAKQPNVRYNPKHIDDNTMILMAIVDSNKNFIYVDIGQKSHLNDRNIFELSQLKKRIENGSLNLPCDEKIPNENKVLPSFFVTTDKMPLKTYLMKQYSNNNKNNNNVNEIRCQSNGIINHNLKSDGSTDNSNSTAPTAGTASEDSDDLMNSDLTIMPERMHFDSKINYIRDKGDSTLKNLINMFQILMDPFKLDCETARKVTLGCITLYNFLKKTSREYDFPSTSTSTTSMMTSNLCLEPEEDYEKTKCFAQIQKQDSTENSDILAQSQRNFLMFYVNKYNNLS